MPLPITMYLRPSGRQVAEEVHHIDQVDEDWFKKQGARVSLEDCGAMGFAMYADVGLKEDDGETPREVLVFTKGRSAPACFRELRQECQKALGQLPT